MLLPLTGDAPRSRAVALLALLGSFGALPSSARADEAVAELALEAGDPRVVATLLADHAVVGDGPFRVGVLFALDPEWHVYWRNPGESGTSTEVIFSGDIETGPTRFPTPTRFVSPGPVITYGYADEVLFLAEAQPRGGNDEVAIRAAIDFLVCKVDCIPARADLSLTLPRGEPEPSAVADLFDSSAASLPRPATNAGLTLRIARGRRVVDAGDRFRLTAELVDCSGSNGCAGEWRELDFFPERAATLRVEDVELVPHPAAFAGAQLVVSLRAGRDAAPTANQTFAGVLRYTQAGVVHGVELTWEIPRGAGGVALDDLLLPRAVPDAPPMTAPRAEAAPSAAGFGWVLGLAFLGGLLLNLMPCVLPVLAIKTLAFAETAGEPARSRMSHGLAYLAGVLLAMLALAALVLAARTSGAALGWGFQFQSPPYLTAIGVLLVVFALNLFGLFEFRLGTTPLSARVDRQRGLVRSLGEGLLTVALATPCSAPFLGTALGFALAGSPALIIAVFLAIGLGLAAPFSLLVMVPAAVRWVPRPGPWMERLRELMGIGLLATLLWLSWVSGRLLGTEGLVRFLSVQLAVAGGLWSLTRLRGFARGVTAMVFLAGAFFVGPWFTRPAPRVNETGASWVVHARDWSAEGVRAAVREDKVAFVVFTADWCITCKANERLVLGQDAVTQALAAPNVATFVADWTTPDEAIRQTLADHGKAGVPMYLVYRAGEPQAPPTVLPEVLTPGILLDALRAAGAS